MKRVFGMVLLSCLVGAAGHAAAATQDDDEDATHEAASQSAAPVAIPDAAAQRLALADLKKLYKDQFAQRKPGQKRAFAEKLLDLAKEGGDDGATRWVALTEAQSLSVGLDDIAGALDAVEIMASVFSGYDGIAERRATLGKIKTPSAQALLKLLDDPMDHAASAEAGRYFCLDADRWEMGAPLLVNGDDAALAKLGALEASPPTQAAKQGELADGWYDAAADQKGARKTAAFLRAHHWYAKALKGLTGVAKERALQHEEELYALIPDSERDYAKLTAQQWDRIPAPMVTVDARTRLDAKMVLKPGQRARLVPQPEDTWTFTWMRRAEATVDWRGDQAAARILGRRAQQQRGGVLTPGALCWQLDDGELQEVEPTKPISGTGRLQLSSYDPMKDADGGTIRVKIIVLDEE